MNTLHKHTLLYGFFTATAMLVYFGFTAAIGQTENFTLRLFNIVIISCGIFFSLKSYLKDRETPIYLLGLGVGTFTSIYTALLFAIVSFFILYIQPDMVIGLKGYEPEESMLNWRTIPVMLFFESFFVGMFVSFICMQWLIKDKPMLDSTSEK